MYKIVFKTRDTTEEFNSTDFGEITNKILEIKNKYPLWFVRGMYKETEQGTVFMDADLDDSQSLVAVSKDNQPLDTSGSHFLCVSYLLCSIG
jgi:hypothetical protein